MKYLIPTLLLVFSGSGFADINPEDGNSGLAQIIFYLSIIPFVIISAKVNEWTILKYLQLSLDVPKLFNQYPNL